jgi:hypothetical protein
MDAPEKRPRARVGVWFEPGTSEQLLPLGSTAELRSKTAASRRLITVAKTTSQLRDSNCTLYCHNY